MAMPHMESLLEQMNMASNSTPASASREAKPQEGEMAEFVDLYSHFKGEIKAGTIQS